MLVGAFSLGALLALARAQGPTPTTQALASPSLPVTCTTITTALDAPAALPTETVTYSQGTYEATEVLSGNVWQYEPKAITDCGEPFTSGDFVAAGSPELLQTFPGGGGNLCGRSIKITNAANGLSVTARLLELCTVCTELGDLQLSPAAWEQLGGAAFAVFASSWELLDYTAPLNPYCTVLSETNYAPTISATSTSTSTSTSSTTTSSTTPAPTASCATAVITTSLAAPSPYPSGTVQYSGGVYKPGDPHDGNIAAYTLSGSTACGQAVASGDYVGAVSAELFTTFPADLCGRTVTITNKATGASVAVQLLDFCATCTGIFDLGLSDAAFAALGGSPSTIAASWMFDTFTAPLDPACTVSGTAVVSTPIATNSSTPVDPTPTPTPSATCATAIVTTTLAPPAALPTGALEYSGGTYNASSTHVGTATAQELTGATACGQAVATTDLVGSVSEALFTSFTGDLCGRTVSVTNPATGAQVDVQLLDFCATCEGVFDIGLSPAAYAALGATGATSDVTWTFSSTTAPLDPACTVLGGDVVSTPTATNSSTPVGPTPTPTPSATCATAIVTTSLAPPAALPTGALQYSGGTYNASSTHVGTATSQELTGSTACGQAVATTDLVGSVSEALFTSFTGDLCGRTVTVTNPATGAQVDVQLLDFCATCEGVFDIGLSPAAYTALGATGATSDVTWTFSSTTAPLDPACTVLGGDVVSTPTATNSSTPVGPTPTPTPSATCATAIVTTSLAPPAALPTGALQYSGGTYNASSTHVGSATSQELTGSTACGQAVATTDLVGSVSAALFNSFTGNLCGRSVSVTNPATGSQVNVQLLDFCATCQGVFDIGLSPAAFALLGVTGASSNVTWTFSSTTAPLDPACTVLGGDVISTPTLTNTSTPGPTPTPTATCVSAVITTTLAPPPALPTGTLYGPTGQYKAADTHTGNITSYNLTASTTCGKAVTPGDFVGAVSIKLFNTFTSNLCGRTVTVTNPSTNLSVSVQLLDFCPTCSQTFDLGLSPAAFAALGGSSSTFAASWVFSSETAPLNPACTVTGSSGGTPTDTSTPPGPTASACASAVVTTSLPPPAALPTGTLYGPSGQYKAADTHTGTFKAYNLSTSTTCGTAVAAGDFVGAVSIKLYNTFTANLCGRSVTVTNPTTGRSVSVQLLDYCPTCTNTFDLGLSAAAFAALGGTSSTIAGSWVFSAVTAPLDPVCTVNGGATVSPPTPTNTTIPVEPTPTGSGSCPSVAVTTSLAAPSALPSGIVPGTTYSGTAVSQVLSTSTACGQAVASTDFVGSVSAALFNIFPGNLCGRTITVTNPDTGGHVDVQLLDFCATCQGAQDIGLSPAAYAQLNGTALSSAVSWVFANSTAPLNPACTVTAAGSAATVHRRRLARAFGQATMALGHRH